MTIVGWIVFALVVLIVIPVAIAATTQCQSVAGRIAVIITAVLILVGVFFGLNWYFKNTASGQRAVVDQKSNLNNGLERTVTVYTANGDVIATYEGEIDIETNDGGYIKFDFEGNRYIYYNCFVESIADIS